MPKVKISEYSATANSNTDVASINIDEGCAPSGINNAIRAVMGHLKDFQQGTNGDPFNGPHNGTVGATTPSTGAFTTLSATGVATFSAGTAALPAITTSGDTNTGIWFPAADTIAFTEGGAEAARIDSSGNLLVTKTATGDGTSGFQTGAGRTSLTRDGATVLFTTRLTSDGEIVGLYKDNTQVGAIGSLSGGMYLGSGSSGTNRLTIDSSGNVGIGTTNTSTKLVVGNGNASEYIDVSINGGTSANYGPVLNFLKGGTSFGQISNYGRIQGGTSSDFFITSVGSNALLFGIGQAEKARIDTSGNLLVNATSGSAGKIYVIGGASQSAILATTSALDYAGIQGAHTVNASNAYVAYFANSGSTTGLYISNTAAWQSTSDERLKTDIQDLDSTQRLMQLRPRDYLWKSQETSDDPTKRNLGFIAQEVKDIFPELVGVSPDGMFSVEYTGLIAPLVKAIQELKAEFDAYKASHP